MHLTIATVKHDYFKFDSYGWIQHHCIGMETIAAVLVALAATLFRPYINIHNLVFIAEQSPRCNIP